MNDVLRGFLVFGFLGVMSAATLYGFWLTALKPDKSEKTFADWLLFRLPILGVVGVILWLMRSSAPPLPYEYWVFWGFIALGVVGMLARRWHYGRWF